MSTLSLLDPNFWAGSKPIFYPLLIKALGNSLQVIPLFQLLISITAWGLLAYSFSNYMSSLKLNYLAFAIILLFSTNTLLVPWDAAIMSESISLPLLALIIALWLFFIKNNSWPIFTALILVSCSWMFSRDSNAWIGMVLGGGLLFTWLLRRNRQVLAIGVILCSAFLVNYLLGGLILNMDQRWVIPLLNVIEKRVLKNENRVQFFASQGMPVSPALMEMRDQDYNGNNNAFYNSPELGTFRDWLLKDGRKSYMLFLVHDPNYLFIRPFADVAYLNERENKDNYQPATFTYPLLPSWVNEIVLINIEPKGLILGGVIFSGIAVAFLISRRDGFWLTLTFLLMLVYPHLLIAWHGDSAGLSRHTLLANIQLRLAIWLFILAIINEVVLGIKKLKPEQESAKI